MVCRAMLPVPYYCTDNKEPRHVKHAKARIEEFGISRRLRSLVMNDREDPPDPFLRSCSFEASQRMRLSHITDFQVEIAHDGYSRVVKRTPSVGYLISSRASHNPTR